MDETLQIKTSNIELGGFSVLRELVELVAIALTCFGAQLSLTL